MFVGMLIVRLIPFAIDRDQKARGKELKQCWSVGKQVETVMDQSNISKVRKLRSSFGTRECNMFSALVHP